MWRYFDNLIALLSISGLLITIVFYEIDLTKIEEL